MRPRMPHPTSPRHSRRAFLGAAGAGLFAPALASHAGTAPRKSLSSCIIIFYYGGQSHLDTLDPKPAAPAEIRGAYHTIATSVPGVRVTEHLPRTARLMHRL